MINIAIEALTGMKMLPWARSQHVAKVHFHCRPLSAPPVEYSVSADLFKSNFVKNI